MKIYSLIALAGASHFRGGSYRVENAGSELKITNTQTWRRFNDNYFGTGPLLSDQEKVKENSVLVNLS